MAGFAVLAVVVPISALPCTFGASALQCVSFISTLELISSFGWIGVVAILLVCRHPPIVHVLHSASCFCRGAFEHMPLDVSAEST